MLYFSIFFLSKWENPNLWNTAGDIAWVGFVKQNETITQTPLSWAWMVGHARGTLRHHRQSSGCDKGCPLPYPVPHDKV